MEEWPEDVQQEVVELFKEYHHIFALSLTGLHIQN